MTVLIRDLQPFGIQTLEGTVTRRIDDDDFIVRDSTGTIRVDADLDDLRLTLNVGERVTVIGRLDDDSFEFEARRITRANGSVLYDRLGAVASSQDDILTGGRQRDVFNGGDGNDQLGGRGGNDRLNGAAGDDWLTGGLGRDTLIGGAGFDRFIYQAVQEKGDRITDFLAADDVIDVSAIFSRPEYGSSQAFADYIQLNQVGANTRVQLDPDGDLGRRGFVTLATLTNVAASSLTAQNFSV